MALVRTASFRSPGITAADEGGKRRDGGKGNLSSDLIAIFVPLNRNCTNSL